jgi:hypothetical protein
MAGQWTPDPSLPEPDLHQRLYQMGRRYCDEYFDPKVNMIHQKPRDHIIVQSASYAVGLMMTGDPADRDRAEAILQNIVAAQDTRPNSKTRGEWLWRLEDKWTGVKGPIDLNSAVFVGSSLEAIISMDRKHPSLDPALREKVEQAAKLATEEILQRNVDPGYSNMALLSTSVAAGAETLWHLPGAAKFADDKLTAVLNMANGGMVYEYLAPTYLAVQLGGAYGARQYAFSDAFAAKADAMIKNLWNEIAMAYDAPTYNICGPNNRSYGENMLDYSAGVKYWLYLALDGNYPLTYQESGPQAWDQAGLMGLAALPLGARPEFKEPIPAWQEITVVGPDDGLHPPRHLFQYHDGSFCLGTVEFQDEWKQKRNLTAYWRTDLPAPANFRVGFCLDESNETLPNGFPYARISFHGKQVKGAALVALVASTSVPKTGSSNCLVFAKDAQFTPAANGGPNQIVDGSETAYLYPVTTGAATYQSAINHGLVKVTRAWNSADAVGNLHVLSYLLVFRPTEQPAPQVSGITLVPDGDEVTAHARVDGDDLSVSFKN